MKKQAEELVSELFCELKKIDDEIKKSGIKPKWIIPVNRRIVAKPKRDYN